MAKISGNHSAEQIHCDAFRRENSDLDIRRPTHNLYETPLDSLPADPLEFSNLTSASAHRSLVTFTTRKTSFDVWAALACLENLLSDYRRIAPRYHFMQTAGEASVAAGNEYRLTLSDPALLASLNAALHKMASTEVPLPQIEQRIMDVRVVRAGPWGGETGELVVEALRNHARAGASSLWVLAHDDADDGNMRITLDALEIARWAWAPDLFASQANSGEYTQAHIIDWNYLFERLAQLLDGVPDTAIPGAAFSITAESDAIAKDNRVIETLNIHGGLLPFFDQLKVT